MKTALFRNFVSVVNEAKKKNAEENLYSRRDVLKLGTALTVLAATPKFLLDSTDYKVFAEEKKIAIIGGGLAGLTAGYELKKKNIVASIYEGQYRLGGRCWTNRNNYFENGQYYENAGEFIDSIHTDLIALTKELGLKLENYLKAVPKGSETKYYFNDTLYTDSTIIEEFRKILPGVMKDAEELYPVTYKSKEARAFELDNMSIKDWIEKYVPGGLSSSVGKFIKVSYEIEFGAEITELSALSLVTILGFADPLSHEPQIFGESDEAFHVKGGNDQIVTKLAEKLKGQVKTNYWLTKIEKVDKQYKLTFKNGETATYDIVLLAIPFSVLRSNVDYKNAGFRPLKMTAIEELGMGDNAKLTMQFKKRIWNDTNGNGGFYGDLGLQAGWEASRAQPGETGLLMVFKGGKASEELSNKMEQDAAKEYLAKLEKIFPGITQEWNGKARINYFKYNPWVQGAYSYYKVGQFTKFAGIEGENEENVYFAGEHTSLEFQGFMNGAVVSGKKAAENILATHF